MVKPARKLLFAFDFGESARAALDTVTALASALKTDVVLVHVQRSKWHSWLSSRLVDRQARDRLETWASRIRERGVQVEAEVISEHGNDVATALAGVAEVERVYGIVVGGTEHPGGKTRFEDRTIENLARLSRQPVWVVKARAGQAALPRRILCGVDPSEESGEALRLTAEIATELGASASVVHAVSSPDLNPLGMSDEEEEREHEAHKQEASRQLEAFVAHNLSPPLPTRVQWGKPADVLVNIARDDDVDLLVLGPGRTGKLKRAFLGTTASKVLYESPISVLLVGEGGLERGRRGRH